MGGPDLSNSNYDPAPPPPTLQDPSVRAAQDRARANARYASGYRSTILSRKGVTVSALAPFATPVLNELSRPHGGRSPHGGGAR